MKDIEWFASFIACILTIVVIGFCSINAYEVGTFFAFFEEGLFFISIMLIWSPFFLSGIISEAFAGLLNETLFAEKKASGEATLLLLVITFLLTLFSLYIIYILLKEIVHDDGAQIIMLYVSAMTLPLTIPHFLEKINR